jgi:gamma-glutamyl:cysteine ligase YbdK (ATP-grasp superfamily)
MRALTEVDIKPELHQSIVEVGTKVCQTPAEVREELVCLCGGVMILAARHGLNIAAAGTHLYSRVYSSELIEENKWHAVRYGLDGKQEELPARALVTKMIEWFSGDVVDELGSRWEGNTLSPSRAKAPARIASYRPISGLAT